jgi:hypothetical protein
MVMELARSTIQQNYIKQVKVLEAKIEKATEYELNLNVLDDAQKQLDALAEKYQHNAQVGSAIYKLYELQAVLHYFEGNDDQAIDFINQAIETRGSNYPRAEKLKTQLLETSETNVSDMSEHLMPLQFQALIKGQRSSAIIMAVLSILSIYFIPWGVFYIILATKLDPKKVPSRGLVKAAAIATLPLCLGLIPILIDIEFWRMNKKLKEYQELDTKAFISDKQWLEDEPKRKKRRRISLSILTSIIVILAVLILIAILNGGS